MGIVKKMIRATVSAATGYTVSGMQRRKAAYFRILVLFLAATFLCMPWRMQAKAAVKNKITVKAVNTGKLTTAVNAKYNLNASAVTGKLTYRSSRPKVVSVSSKGVVKGLKAGTAVITISGKQKATAKIQVTVVNRSKFKSVKNIKFNGAVRKMTAGQAQKLKVSFTPSKASNKNLVFSSSNKKIATVSAGGKITAKKAGSAKITASSSENPKARATLNVIVEKPSESSGSHILVACFSATGHTAPIARYAAEILGADYYEIKATDPYTEADLAYYTGSRCDQEQDDPDVRPAISGRVENMDQYDTVLIGHPIWHGQAPRIISTFLESYEFSGKTLTTFCTSASSGLGSSASNLYGLVPENVTWLKSRRFPIGAEKEDVSEWLDEIGLTGSTEEKKEMKIQIAVGNETRTATLSDNASAAAFYKLLSAGPLTVAMHDYGGFEKVGPLGTSLVRSDTQITTTPGDIILYQGNQITIYYDVNSWNFTLLGHIDNATDNDMKKFLGSGDPSVTFSLP